MSALTRKQERALLALAYPDSRQAGDFWVQARSSWAGPRKTLGSLIGRGLASYSHEGGWKITDAGYELVEEMP